MAVQQTLRGEAVAWVVQGMVLRRETRGRKGGGGQAGAPLRPVALHRKGMLSGALDATRRDDWQHACSRRGVLTALVSSVLGLTLLPAWRAGAAEAPVALPDKVQQFARLLADRQAWTALGQALRKRTDAVSDGEWHSIQVYLRQLYQDAAVLDAMAAARPASEGPLRALASEFRQRVRQLDGPAKQRDKEAFLQGHARTVEVLGRFLERWQASSDVPAEL